MLAEGEAYSSPLRQCLRSLKDDEEAHPTKFALNFVLSKALETRPLTV